MEEVAQLLVKIKIDYLPEPYSVPSAVFGLGVIDIAILLTNTFNLSV